MPKNDTPYSAEELGHFRARADVVEARRQEILKQLEVVLLFSDAEITSRLADAARHNLEAVENPEIRERLTPNWSLGCRRPLISNKYYPIFNRLNVNLIDTGIAQVRAEGIVTSDGKLRPTDVIILATGFQTTRFLSALDITGRSGLHIERAWADGAIAYLGITTSGFPNLFMLYGPNTNGGSFITMLEMQADYALRKIKDVLDGNSGWIDVQADAQADYNKRLQSDIGNISVWNGDCGGYYRTPSGRIVTQFPYTMTRYREMLSIEDSANFEWH
jgi:cation diffusion facilitator CzcD-associated flavoprotein CzcO